MAKTGPQNLSRLARLRWSAFVYNILVVGVGGWESKFQLVKGTITVLDCFSFGEMKEQWGFEVSEIASSKIWAALGYGFSHMLWFNQSSALREGFYTAQLCLESFVKYNCIVVVCRILKCCNRSLLCIFLCYCVSYEKTHTTPWSWLWFVFREQTRWNKKDMINILVCIIIRDVRLCN